MEAFCASLLRRLGWNATVPDLRIEIIGAEIICGVQDLRGCARARSLLNTDGQVLWGREILQGWRGD